MCPENSERRDYSPSTNIGGNDLVTVVVTTYNRQELVKRAILSVIAQTYRPIEILVIEDGSKSDVEKWCHEISHGRINYILHKSNKGLAAARNTGMKEANGSYIAYLDDDDEWRPERISRQMDLVRNLSQTQLNQLGVVSCGVEMRFPEKERVSIRTHGNTGNLRESIIRKGSITPSSTFLFPTHVLRELGGFDEKLPSSIDHDIWMTLAVNGYYGYAVNDPLVINYDRSGRATMMNDISNRIIGVRKYLEKWSHTYTEWFGIEQSCKYKHRYFASVIASLVAEKFWNRDYRNAYKAMSEIFRYSNSYIFNVISTARAISIVGAQRLLPSPAISIIKEGRRLFGHLRIKSK